MTAPVEPPSVYDAPAAPRPGRMVVGGLAALVVVLAAALAWSLSRGSVQDAPPPPPTNAAGGLAARDLNGDFVVYQSGLHPWIVEDAPGQCPVCGMDLQPVPVTGVGSGTVEIDPATVQSIGVRTARVTVEALARSLRTTGVVEASERARTALSLKTSGWIEKLYVSAEGDRVRAGQPVFEVYSPQLVSTQEEYLLALRTRALLGEPDGRRLVEAARRRLELFDLRPAQIEALEGTGEVQRTVTVYAPASGTVVEHRVVVGQQVAAGTTLLQIVNLGQVWVQVDVPEADLAWVEAGIRARVEVQSQPGREVQGRVEYVYDTLDPATRTGTARLAVANPGLGLKPGMFATVTLYGTPGEAYPTIPSEALIRTGDEAVVLVALGEGRFSPRVVTVGQESGERVQILAGLDEGETVVTSAQFLIDSEARLAAAVGAMASSESPSPSP